MPVRQQPHSPHPQLALLELLHVAGGLSVLAFGALFLLFGMRGPAAVEASYTLFTACTLAWLHFTKRGFHAVVWMHVIIVVLVPFGVSVGLGGLMPSGGFMVWGLIGPLAAMMFLGQRATWVSGGLFLAALTTSAVVPTFEGSPWVTLPQAWMMPALAVANISGASILVLATMYYFVQRLRHEQDRADALLLGLLPLDVARVLASRRGTVGRQGSGASVLYAAIADFTPLCDRLAPSEVIDLVNALFLHFDDLAAAFGLERANTAGDAYMVIAGVPKVNHRHAHDVSRLALAMRAAVASRRFAGQRIDLRVAINSGPVAAGSIGRRAFLFDVWGRAVNLASRMESDGEPGCIQITRESWQLVNDEFVCRPAGSRTLLASGAIEVWDLLDDKAALASL